MGFETIFFGQIFPQDSSKEPMMLALNSRRSFRLLRVTPEGNKGEVNLVNRVVSGHSRRTYERRDQHL